MSKDTMTKEEKAAVQKALAVKQREKARAERIAEQDAKKEAAKAAKAARAAEEASAEKVAADAAKAEDIAAAEKTLTPLAKEINERIEKAALMDGKADDHRLAAALQLAKAKALCEEHKISFKEWAEKNVTTQAYETIRKLAAVGASDDPKLALADMRGKNKDANKKHRAARAGGKPGSRDTGKSGGPKETPFTIADKAVAALDDKAAISLLEGRANKLGMRVVSEHDAKVAREASAPKAITTSIETVKTAFSALKASDRMAFVKWAAEAVGVTISSEFGTGQALADPGEIPAELRRQPSRRGAAAAPAA